MEEKRGMRYRLVILDYHDKVSVIPYLFESKRQAKQYLLEYICNYRDYKIISENKYQLMMGNLPKFEVKYIKRAPKTPVFYPPTGKM